jgi:hypothetical protein
MFKNTTVWKSEWLYSIRSDTLRKVMWSWLPSVASDNAEKQKKIEKVKSRPWVLLSAENLRLTTPNANKNYTFGGNGLFGIISAHMLLLWTVLVLILKGFRLLGSAVTGNFDVRDFPNKVLA